MGKTKTKPVFKVTIDYGKSLFQMLKESKMEKWELLGKITKEKFPVKGAGKHKVSIVLFRCNLEPYEFGQARDRISKRGYRPAKIEEIIALVKTHSAKKLFKTNDVIVALGSIWHDGGPEQSRGYVPCVCDDLEKTRIGITPESETYQCLFAAVRKISKKH